MALTIIDWTDGLWSPPDGRKSIRVIYAELADDGEEMRSYACDLNIIEDAPDRWRLHNDNSENQWWEVDESEPVFPTFEAAKVAYVLQVAAGLAR